MSYYAMISEEIKRGEKLNERIEALEKRIETLEKALRDAGMARELCEVYPIVKQALEDK
ncbi:MAG: hypothetical protein LLG04_10965 [Parachlamydia sp.]|nr:hypothetical protein [Parachlamydia sp.]